MTSAWRIGGASHWLGDDQTMWSAEVRHAPQEPAGWRADAAATAVVWANAASARAREEFYYLTHGIVSRAEGALRAGGKLIWKAPTNRLGWMRTRAGKHSERSKLEK